MKPSLAMSVSRLDFEMQIASTPSGHLRPLIFSVNRVRGVHDGLFSP